MCQCVPHRPQRRQHGPLPRLLQRAALPKLVDHLLHIKDGWDTSHTRLGYRFRASVKDSTQAAPCATRAPRARRAPSARFTSAMPRRERLAAPADTEETPAAATACCRLPPPSATLCRPHLRCPHQRAARSSATCAPRQPKLDEIKDLLYYLYPDTVCAWRCFCMSHAHLRVHAGQARRD